MRRMRSLGVLVSCAIIAGTLFTAPAGATPLSWNLAADFRRAPDQANPGPDQYGNPEVWFFMAGLGEKPATYELLTTFVSNAFDVEGLEQWQGIFDPGDPNAKLPAVGVNATGIDQHPTTFTWPADAIRLHPLRKRSVVIGWQSPIDGSIVFDARYETLDYTGGNGYQWGAFVQRGGVFSPRSSGYTSGGGVEYIDGVTLSAGDFLYLVLGSFEGDYSYDSVQFDLTVTEVQS